jgi:hypothetical protein
LPKRRRSTKTNAAITALEDQHQSNLTKIATKGETERGKQVAQIAAANLKDQATLFSSILDPVASGIDTIFDSVIRGTQSVSQAFRRMAQDILLSIAKSGIKDLLLGGQAGGLGASIFGTQGAGGGLAGIIASAFGGPAITGSLSAAFSSAFTSALPSVTSSL